MEARARLQPALRASSEANTNFREALDADEDTSRAVLHCQATDATLTRIFGELKATLKRLSEFEPEELEEHEELDDLLDRGLTTEEYDAKLEEPSV